MNVEKQLCLQCGKEVIQNPHRKGKKFCSDSCRNNWWNINRHKRSARFLFLCPGCGEEFETDDKRRKYCSHECYVNDRFRKNKDTETAAGNSQGQEPSGSEGMRNPEHDMQVFENSDFGSIRVLMIGREPWFVAADVCLALDIDRTQTRRLDNDEKGVGSIHTLGGVQEMLIVNESGLYSLVLGSRKPEAKAFKRWVTHEVLPSIRKTGQYVPEVSDNVADRSPIQDFSETDMDGMEFYDLTGMLLGNNQMEDRQPFDAALPAPVSGSSIAIGLGDFVVHVSDNFRVDTLEKVLEVMRNVQGCVRI